MNTLEAIRTRRSTRKFEERKVGRELLDQIIEAGRFAPSGGNSQTTHFIVVQNKEILNRLEEKVKNAFASMEETPVLIIAANQKDYGNNIADCACALENMMIAANELDLGSCWINQLRWLNEESTILEEMHLLGMQESERVYGALAVGYPATEDQKPNRNPLERTGNKVTFID